MKRVVVLTCMLVGPTAFAQPDTSVVETAPHDTAGFGAKGLTFSVPSGGGPTFGFAYFISDSASVRVDFGLALESQTGMMGGDRANTAGFSIEAGYRAYKPIVGKLTAFLQPSLYLAKTPGVDWDNAMSAALTAGFGVEYWITPQLSVSGSTGLALQAKSDMTSSFNTFTLTTGTSALSASFYWK
jgi:hypothetical protein